MGGGNKTKCSIYSRPNKALMNDNWLINSKKEPIKKLFLDPLNASTENKFVSVCVFLFLGFHSLGFLSTANEYGKKITDRN